MGTTSSFSVRPIVGLGHPHIPFLVFASITDLASIPFWGTHFPSRLIHVPRLLQLSPANFGIDWKALQRGFPGCLLTASLHPPFDVHVKGFQLEESYVVVGWSPHLASKQYCKEGERLFLLPMPYVAKGHGSMVY